MVRHLEKSYPKKTLRLSPSSMKKASLKFAPMQPCLLDTSLKEEFGKLSAELRSAVEHGVDPEKSLVAKKRKETMKPADLMPEKKYSYNPLTGHAFEGTAAEREAHVVKPPKRKGQEDNISDRKKGKGKGGDKGPPQELCDLNHNTPKREIYPTKISWNLENQNSTRNPQVK